MPEQSQKSVCQDAGTALMAGRRENRIGFKITSQAPIVLGVQSVPPKRPIVRPARRGAFFRPLPAVTRFASGPLP